MIRDAGVRITGAVAAWIGDYAARQYGDLATDLLREAVEAWHREGFARLDDHEVNCTIRIYDWCDRIIAQNRSSWPAMRVTYDAPLPSAAMRRGTMDASRSARPDLWIWVGGRPVLVEAKRLAATGDLARRYVTEGMMRFFSGHYSTNGSVSGFMLSYSVNNCVSDSMATVNVRIRNILDDGESRCVMFQSHLGPALDLYLSASVPDCGLLHFAVEM